MDVLKIANLKFNKNIEFLHVAMEPIIAYSVVFGATDGNITKVYTSQNATFDNGTPWVMGIAQNTAQIGETVEVQYFGLSKVRFFSRNVPANQFIYLLNNSDGVCCLNNEAGIDTFKRNGKSIMIGNVLPRTQPVMGSTLEPRQMLVDCYIHIESSAAPEAVQENVFQLNYRIYYTDPPIPPYNLTVLVSSAPNNFLFSYKRQIKDNENTPIGVGTYQIEIYFVEISADKKTGEMIGDFTAHHEFGKQGNNYDVYLNGNIRLQLGLRPGQIEIDPSKPYEFIFGNQLDNIAATSVYKDRVKINFGNNSLRLTNGYQYTIKGIVSSNNFDNLIPPAWSWQ
jgi:hypothetical protein